MIFMDNSVGQKVSKVVETSTGFIINGQYYSKNFNPLGIKFYNINGFNAYESRMILSKTAICDFSATFVSDGARTKNNFGRAISFNNNKSIYYFQSLDLAAMTNPRSLNVLEDKNNNIEVLYSNSISIDVTSDYAGMIVDIIFEDSNYIYYYVTSNISGTIGSPNYRYNASLMCLNKNTFQITKLKQSANIGFFSLIKGYDNCAFVLLCDQSGASIGKIMDGKVTWSSYKTIGMFAYYQKSEFIEESQNIFTTLVYIGTGARIKITYDVNNPDLSSFTITTIANPGYTPANNYTTNLYNYFTKDASNNIYFNTICFNNIYDKMNNFAMQGITSCKFENNTLTLSYPILNPSLSKNTKGILVTDDKEYVILVTEDEAVIIYKLDKTINNYSITKTITCSAKQIGLDKDDNLWILDKDNNVDFINFKSPVEINIEYKDKDITFQGAPINSSILISCTKDNTKLEKNIKLIINGAAKFENNQSEINIITSEIEDIEIPIIINNYGLINISYNYLV